MEGLNEIATTGAPGIMAALGMGTVFLYLALLYWITRVIGSWRSSRTRSAVGGSRGVDPWRIVGRFRTLRDE
jgi:hypothetical protein